MERYHYEEEDKIYENIGARVLENWHSDHDEANEVENDAVVSHVSMKLDTIISHSEKRSKDWVPEMKELIDSMDVADFASHGKKICLFLLSKNEKAQPHHTKSKAKEAPKKKHHKKEKKVVPPTRKIVRRDENDYLCRKIFFPKWLPSVCNED